MLTSTSDGANMGLKWVEVLKCIHRQGHCGTCGQTHLGTICNIIHMGKHRLTGWGVTGQAKGSDQTTRPSSPAIMKLNNGGLEALKASCRRISSTKWGKIWTKALLAKTHKQKHLVTTFGTGMWTLTCRKNQRPVLLALLLLSMVCKLTSNWFLLPWPCLH